MTSRYNSVTVTFDQEIREDDIEPLSNAILMLKGVIAVDPSDSGIEHIVAKRQVANDIREDLYKLINKWLM